MARPQQQIILTVARDDLEYDVIASEGIWAILYQGKPFNMRTSNYAALERTRKYLKILYPNPGHAHLTARKLNETFMTEDFTVNKIL